LRQRRVTEEELRRSRERYRGLLEASPGAVALYDRSLLVAEWNAAAERLYGYDKSEVIGRPLPTVPEGKGDEIASLLQSVDDGKPVLDFETVRCDVEGRLVDVQLSLLPYREREHRYYLEVTADIRERVRMRQMLLELEKLTSMGKMAAGTAHHMNTPLAAMLLRVQMMRERAENGMAGDLEQLENTIGFCQQFVRRLLDFSRRPTLHKQAEEVRPLILAVLGFLAPSVISRRAKVTTELDAMAGTHVYADRNQLETVLLILLSNALDAISMGGHIAVRCRNDGDSVLIDITDDGCGISETDMARIFEPFFTTKPPGKGTGLGLAIARNIVAEHGGRISLAPGPQKGTTATVQLPQCRVGLAEEVSS
jgi:PAS domain S-box-containing protein